MSVTVYSQGITVDAVVGAPPATPPASTGNAAGAVTVYAGGNTVDVRARGPVAPNPIPINVVSFDPLTAVSFVDHHAGTSAYQRFMNHRCWTTRTFSLQFQKCGFDGQPWKAFAYPTYAMFVDGVERARSKAPTGAVPGTFNVTLGNEADAPHLFSIAPCDASGALVVNPTETFIPFWMWTDLGGTAKDHPMVVFQNGSFDWVKLPKLPYLWALVPKTRLKQPNVPQNFWSIPSVDSVVNNTPGVPPHIFPGGEPFNTALAKTALKRINYVPVADDICANLHRPSLTKRGIVVTECIQGYLPESGATAVTPQQPMLDGPRGQATLTSPTSLWPSHAGAVYYLDTFSFGKVVQNGTKQTFAGLRHKGPYPPYWGDLNAAGIDVTKIDWNLTEVVGNWDPSIPKERRFPWESWGFKFDTRSLKHDLAHYAPIPPFPDLPIHFGPGPVAFATCRFGRLLKFQFHLPPNASSPPDVSEWIPFGALSDPWGMDLDGNVIYIAERGANRISMWSADTPNTFLGVLLENVNGAQFGALPTALTWKRRWTANPAYLLANGEPNYPVLRQQNILAPEGLAIQDGLLYWGSLAQGEVRRINLTTKAVEICCRPFISYAVQSLWIEVKLSDGSFGPRGTIFTTTFDNQYFGRPRAFLPIAGTDNVDGAAMTNTNMVPYAPNPSVYVNQANWDWANWGHASQGPGGMTEADVYACAVGINNGMLAIGSSGPGLTAWIKNTGDATPSDAVMTRGWTYYRSKGYTLFGNQGYWYVDAPLPWGENADCDAWLTNCGHTRPAP